MTPTPKKKIASEKLTQIVHTRLSQSDYDILLKRATAENSGEQKINLSKYLNSIIHDSIIANSHSLKMSLRQIEQVLLNIDSRLLQIEKNTEAAEYPSEMIQKISECLSLLQTLQADLHKIEAEVSKWLSQN